jgi:hypothetical protein
MICSFCKEDKEGLFFYKNSGRKTGLDHMCIACRKAYIKVWSKTEAGSKCRAKARREFYLSNKDYELSKSRQWRKGKREGTPSWLTQDQLKQIEYTYALARDCKVTTGEPYEVDHIVPLRGENVCGLHVPWNLQVLPRDINAGKGNRLR